MCKSAKRIPRDPMACITRRMPLREDQQRDLGIAYHASLQALLRGHGDEQSWSTLACALNIALLLCEQGIAAAYLPTIQQAQAALLNSKWRAEIHHRWAFSGDEARLVMRACSIHDEQISHATRSQITSAIAEVHRRIEEGETV